MASLKRAYDNQIDAARKIEATFRSADTRYCFLNSRVQSGKTGVFQTLIRRMFHSALIDRCYILCGMSDVDLYGQARRETHLYNADIESNISVIFHQDFKSAPRMNTNRCLIVVDESHTDQGIRQQRGIFLAKHKLGMDGTAPHMIRDNTYILSVSATGFSELAAIAHNGGLKKEIVNLVPGAGYFGPEEYWAANLVKPTFSIEADPAAFAALFRPNTWNLMRVPGGKVEKKEAYAQFIRDTCEAAGIRVCTYNAKHDDIRITCDACEDGDPCPGTDRLCLSHAPEQPTLVLIDGRLRAGKVVPKKHIGFVWEGADQSKTDSVIQGLVGRMAGYVFGAQKPTLFVPPCLLATKDSKEIKECEFERYLKSCNIDCCDFLTDHEMMPTKATNLMAPVNPTRPEHNNLAPAICFNLGEEREWTAEGDLSTRARENALKGICLSTLKSNIREIICNHPTLTQHQKDEIIREVLFPLFDESECHIRNIRRGSAESQLKYLEDVVVAAANHVIPTSQHISDCPFLTFIVPEAGIRAPGLRPGDVFAIFYLQNRTELPGKNLEAKICAPKPNCAFVSHTIHTEPDVAATMAVSVLPEHIATQEAFKTSLRRFVTTRDQLQRDGFAAAKCLTFQQCRFAKTEFAYTSKTNNAIRTLLNELTAELGVNFTLKFVRGATRATSTHFALDTITWS
jgi:hypothetical protein